MIDQLIFIFDKLGIIAFAFMAVSLGIKKKLDIFGLLLIGVISSIGGGVLRDILLARVPYAISHIEYMLFAFGATMFSITLFYYEKKINERFLLFADTLGLAAFAVSGALVSISAGLNIFVTFLFAVITATGGGLIRDIILNEIPFILKRDVYATAAGVGGMILQLLIVLSVGIPVAIASSMGFIILLRIYVLRNSINLPIIKTSNGHKKS